MIAFQCCYGTHSRPQYRLSSTKQEQVLSLRSTAGSEAQEETLPCLHHAACRVHQAVIAQLSCKQVLKGEGRTQHGLYEASHRGANRQGVPSYRSSQAPAGLRRRPQHAWRGVSSARRRHVVRPAHPHTTCCFSDQFTLLLLHYALPSTHCRNTVSLPLQPPKCLTTGVTR